jgi:hypothetical protein
VSKEEEGLGPCDLRGKCEAFHFHGVLLCLRAHCTSNIQKLFVVYWKFGNETYFLFYKHKAAFFLVFVQGNQRNLKEEGRKECARKRMTIYLFLMSIGVWVHYIENTTWNVGESRGR